MRYRITIDFEADRPLTPEEVSGLVLDISPQIEEPRVYNEEQGMVDAEWRSDNIDISFESPIFH